MLPFRLSLALLVGLLPGVTRAERPPLIPRKVLFGNPVRVSPRLSPDGKRLAYLAPDPRDVLQIWVRTLGKDDDRQVTSGGKHGIPAFQWTYAPDTLIFLQDHNGDEHFHLFTVRLKDKTIRDLTPFEGIQAEPLAVHPDFPDQLLAAIIPPGHHCASVYRINLTSGAQVLDTENPGDVADWEVGPRFQIRAAQAELPDGSKEVRFRDAPHSPWRVAVRWGPEDADSHIVSLSSDAQFLWLFSNSKRDTLALVKHQLRTGKQEVVAADDHADATAIVLNPITRQVEAVGFNRQRLRWKVLDPKFAADFKVLEQQPGEPRVVGFDRSLKTWLVAYSKDTQPKEYFVYDRTHKKLTPLFSAQPALTKYRLAPMKPVVIRSRDGLDLVSYLTLPLGVKPKKLPLVLLVHGGPWARDLWGYNSQAQWLANRGYAVLSVNYRGSIGFGRRFLHAGDREWGGKMHNDLLDAVQWAVKQGYADPKRVAIFGGSYGGYAALVGATFTPDVFACAIDVVGPSNLVTMIEAIPPEWTALRRLFAARVGNVETEKKFLEARSPLFKAERIRIPVLIAQGANDTRVKQSESEQIVAALRRHGKPVEYMLFPDEGHGFDRPKNRLKFCAAAEVFLAKHLGGGRVEPAPKEAK